MAEIMPFKGILYNENKVGGLRKVVTPPYDVIPDEEREEYYRNSRWNVIRLVLGKDSPEDNEKENKYTRANDYMLKWLEEGVLQKDVKPAIYYLKQEFKLVDSGLIVRRGFISLIKLDDYKYVLPHEKTLSGPKKDRLKLLESCRSNFSPVFTFYSDPEKAANRIVTVKEKTKPDMLVDFKGVKESLWKITEPGLINELSLIAKARPFYIADGHHRYATALNYQAAMKASNPVHTGNEAYNYTMVYFTNMDDEGLVIFPTHRMIRNIKDFKADGFLASLGADFKILPCKDDKEMLGQLEKSSDNRQMGLCLENNKYFLITPEAEGAAFGKTRERSEAYYRLNVAALHELVLKKILNAAEDTFDNIIYTRNAEEVVEQVKKGIFQAGFILQPISISQLRDVVKSKDLMPRKATYFYPKLLSGLVINRLD